MKIVFSWMSAVAIVLSCYLPGDALAGEKPESGTDGRDEDRSLKVSVKDKSISFDAEVVNASYGLEFLLCTAGGKEYESLLSTKVTPSKIHAALLMLGLYPGIPAYYGNDGTYIPPRGGELKIIFEWKDAKGKKKTANAEDWLKLSREDEKKHKPDRWVFLGSDVMPDGTYLADQTGGIIAVANLATAVIDVPFESARELKSRSFVVNREVIPRPGTDVRITIRALKGAVNAKYARAVLDIDRFGRLIIDNRQIAWDELSRWAEKYIEDHSEGMVVIRLSPFALAHYGPRARLELKLGGVYHAREVTMDNTEKLLPCTDRQLKAAAGQWKDRFANPREQLTDPGIIAKEEIERIQKRRADLQQMDRVLEEYTKILEKEIEAGSREEK